jgi:chromosome partitioning protein
VLTTSIPSASDVERMGLERTIIEAFAPRSRAAKAYRDLWSEIRARLDTPSPAP